MNVLGISRAKQFSPGSVARDAAIFDAVASRIFRLGHEVSIISEDFFIGVEPERFDLIFSMARSASALRFLEEAEREKGVRIINSPAALLSMTRKQIMLTFREKNIAQPAFFLLDSSTSEVPACGFPLWLKRADACAQAAGDVCFVPNAEEYAAALKNYAERGIQEVVAMAHVEGDLVKFYGVEGTEFFHVLYPTRDADRFSKFGLETHNSPLQDFPLSIDALKLDADAAAQATGFYIYGGDAIVRADGTHLLIDFNDWPSFSPCRKYAARAIAERVLAP